MLILIKTPTITFSLDVQPSDDTELIYTKVAERTEYKRFQFNLLFSGQPLSKGQVSKCGISKEATLHMNIIKELRFNILYKDAEHQITMPNNDGLNIGHLHSQIKNSLASVIPEVSTHNIDVRKVGDPTTLNKHSNLHSTLQILETLELVLVEKPAVSTPSSPTPATTEDGTQFDQDALLNSFLETSISSDVEIVFCFDTTGSMASIIGKVREQVEQTVSRLMKDIPNIRIGIMGLGDYCDGVNVLKTLDLTQDVPTLVKFIKAVPSTSGGDIPEAYEWALRKAKSLSWSSHTSKALVMIGDSEPHEPSHTDLGINWFEECDDLHDMGVKIYAVKALGSCVFYEEIAERTGGICINFNKFSLITEMFLAICYREASKEKFNKFQSEIKETVVSAEMTEIMNDLNKENFIVVSAEKKKEETPSPDDKPDESTATTTTTTDNNNQQATPTPKSVIVKQRGVPIKMRVKAAWFDLSLDNPSKSPTCFYVQETDSFIMAQGKIDNNNSSSTSCTETSSTRVDPPLAKPDLVPPKLEPTFTYPDGVVSVDTLSKLYKTNAARKTAVPKVLVVGDTKIGKTTFVNQMNKIVKNKIVFEEKNKSPIHDIQGVSAFAVCFDSNNPNSVEHIADYIYEIRYCISNSPIFLVCLRSDKVVDDNLVYRDLLKFKFIYNLTAACQTSTLDSEEESKIVAKLFIDATKKSCSIM